MTNLDKFIDESILASKMAALTVHAEAVFFPKEVNPDLKRAMYSMVQMLDLVTTRFERIKELRQEEKQQ